MNSNHVHSEVYLIQPYVMKFVSDLRQVGGFLQVLQFPSLIKLTRNEKNACMVVGFIATFMQSVPVTTNIVLKRGVLDTT